MSLVTEVFFNETGRRSSRLHPPSNFWDQQIPLKNIPMIIAVAVNLKQLFKRQRKYPWPPRPDTCPRCQNGGLWGHGFVLAYFDDVPAGVFLRRYRCPHCGCVIRIRPEGFFRRFQAPIATIRSSLANRFTGGGYLAGISASRQRHWRNGLVRNVTAHLGDRWLDRLLDGFDRLVGRGYVPVASAV